MQCHFSYLGAGRRFKKSKRGEVSKSNDEYDQRGSNDAVSKVASALIISASEKAGMEGINRSKIDAIILRESGNSAYM